MTLLHEDTENSMVVVDYTFVVEQDGGSTTRFDETHCLRYLFPTEIESLASASGLQCVEIGRWLAEGRPDERDWYAYAILSN